MVLSDRRHFIWRALLIVPLCTFLQVVISTQVSAANWHCLFQQLVNRVRSSAEQKKEWNVISTDQIRSTYDLLAPHIRCTPVI
jgi:hypothetical protein